MKMLALPKSSWKHIQNFMYKLECCRSYIPNAKLHLDIRGVFPAITTPFDKDERILYDKLEANVAKWQAVDFRGYVVQGSTGEVANMSADERVEIVKRLRQFVPKSSGKLLIAGCGCESTKETIAMASKMADAGADAVLVVTPSFYKGRMTTKALENHFIKVADTSSVPVILYSVPGNTTIDLNPDIVVKLSSHPNIIGLKDSGGDITKITYMVYKTRDSGFQILAGSAGFFLAARYAGCVGGIMAVANTLGPQICNLMKLIDDGRHEEALHLQQRLIAPNWAVTKTYGIAGVKQAMEWFGYFGGPPRSPLTTLSNEEKINLRQIFIESGFLRC